jgi:DNA-binding FadR family transcriptional regulator
MALTDEAIVRIKDMIMNGQLSPGDRLPREPDLAQQLGLSRNSLREAVKALSLINILDVRQGDGTYVTSLGPELLLDALTFVVDFHQDDSVLHFLAVRRILEPAAAGLAAERIGEEGIAELREVLAETAGESDADKLHELDLRFHRLIGTCSGNPVLASLLEGLSAPTRRARIWRGLTETGAYPRTVREHTAIVDALEEGDGDVARAAMLLHVSGVEIWVRKVQELPD